MRVIGQWSLDGPKRIAVAEFLSGKTYDPNWRDSTTNLCTKPISKSAHPFARPYWNGWAVDDNNTRFQPAAMAGLRKADIPELELKWTFAFPGETVVEAQPAIIDGKLYTGSRSGLFYALDATVGLHLLDVSGRCADQKRAPDRSDRRTQTTGGIFRRYRRMDLCARRIERRSHLENTQWRTSGLRASSVAFSTPRERFMSACPRLKKA